MVHLQYFAITLLTLLLFLTPFGCSMITESDAQNFELNLDDVRLDKWESSAPLDFEINQYSFERVKKASQLKEDHLKKLLIKNGFYNFDLNIHLVAYKEEQILEVYAQSDSLPYTKLVTYPFSSFSGQLGPKRVQGDLQIPEGFYHIAHFNPKSRFLLSVGINYPNDSDRILSSAKDRGGDIYIHGGEASIGCIPITNDKIQELYLLCVKSKSNGQEKIPVSIFPFKMTDLKMRQHLKNQNYQSHETLWENLQIGYQGFTKTKAPVKFIIGHNGYYQFEGSR